MQILYAFLISLGVLFVSIIPIKTFQLENYCIKKYIKNCLKFEFAFGNKNKLNFTKRTKRLIFCIFFVDFLIFLLFFYLIFNFWINFLLVLIYFIFNYYFVVFSFLIMWPIENMIKNSYLKKAKKKLENMKCKKIAITGSFGKTSTKNILYQILKEEFDVCATPKSFNTPMGVCKTVLEDLKETDDFFIVELGARKEGDIKFLAEFVGVDFGILTPIGNCHLETFGSIENIEQTKYELCDNAKDLVVFNAQSKSSMKLYDKFPRKKFLVCKEGGFAHAKNIVTNSQGSSFSMVIDDKEFECQTKLLGRANIDNIVVASAMAYLVGEQLFNIQRAISKLKPIPHRLELIHGEFVTVLDDSYNSNVQGFKQALEVLSGFEGRKVVVSPGIVELGKSQAEVNFQMGKEVAKVADFFVIMNETNKESLSAGFLSEGENKDRIFYAKTRDGQKEVLKNILKKGDVVLFENDLPDNMK